MIKPPRGTFLRPCADRPVKDWAHCAGNVVASKPEAEDKRREPGNREILANLLLTFNGSPDKVKPDVYVAHGGAIAQLDKSTGRLDLPAPVTIYYSFLCPMKRNVMCASARCCSAERASCSVRVGG